MVEVVVVEGVSVVVVVVDVAPHGVAVVVLEGVVVVGAEAGVEGKYSDVATLPWGR